MGTVHPLLPTGPRRARPVPQQLAELALAVPQVVAHRTARLALASTPPSARDRREFERMQSEKAAAFAEAWLALWWQAVLAQQRLALALMSGSALRAPATIAHALTHSTMQVLGQGLAPLHRQATANARRLRQTRLSLR